MRHAACLAVLGLSLGSAPIAPAATLSGTVTGPDARPFRGAFVEVQNARTRVTVSVLSDGAGRYRVTELPAGDYEIHAKAVGYRSERGGRVSLAEDGAAAADFALKQGLVRWSDISLWQGNVLLPEGKGKAALFRACFACHGFETRMAQMPHEEREWRARVDYMTSAMHFFIAGRFSAADGDDVVGYLTDIFGTESALPRSPAELPKYRQTEHAPFSDEALKIVYVEYEMPGPNRMPWSAVEDRDGHYWIPYYGDANGIARLDAKSGEVVEWKVPNRGTAAVHSAVPAPDGAVWLTEQGSNKLGRWDPASQSITEFQDDYLSGKEGTLAGGSKHTLRVHPDGSVWATGGPLTRFDPTTGKFTRFPQVPSVYGITLDREGTVWFAEFRSGGRIGKVDPKTLAVTAWVPPTATSSPRRIVADSDGTLFFAEFYPGKIGRFDPKSETFKEFPLPGAEPTPYALAVDADHRVWYSSEHLDVLGRLDPATGEVVEFPIPHSENTMREFFADSKGRLWFGSPSNNKVGYFYLAR